MTVRDRLTVASAVAVVLSSSALAPVYQDLGWLPSVLLAALAVTSASALARLAHAPRTLVPVAGLLGLCSYVAVTFAGSTLQFGVVPTTTTGPALAALVTSAVQDVQALAAPVPTTPRLVLLAVLGTGVIAVVVDLLAVVLRRLALSGLPLLGLFAVPSAAAGGELGVLPFLLGAAGWLGLLLAGGSDRVSRWGTFVGGGCTSAGDSSAGRAGWRIGAAALGVAAVVPVATPGLDGRLIGGSVHGAEGAPDTVVYDPMAELAGWLRAAERRTLLTYRSATGPQYLRRITLDVYDPDKGRFTSSGLSGDDDTVQDGVPAPRGRTAKTDSFAVEVELTGRLGGSLLPVPATPTGIDIAGQWRWDVAAETVFSPRSTLLSVDGSYEVRAAHVDVDPAQLRREQTVPADIRKAYAKDPQLSDYAQALLARTTAGMRNDFDRVTAVQRLFRETDFVYSTRTAPRPRGSPDQLTAFLQTRQGACQQYASAMAALVRGLGIPARVAVGFTGGSLLGPDRYYVTTSEAHAWPEVWFKGAGWLRFEPTPGDADVTFDVPEYSLAPPLRDTPNRPTTDPSATAAAPAPSSTAAPGRGDRTDDVAATPPSSQLQRYPSRRWLALPAAITPLLLPAALGVLRRRRAWRRADAHVAWRCVQDDAIDVGHRWCPADSPRKAATQLLHVRPLPDDAAAALVRIALDAERCRYSRTPAPADVPRLHRDADTVRTALLASATPVQRWTARLIPPSTLRWVDGHSSTALAALRDRRQDILSATGVRLHHRRVRLHHRLGRAPHRAG